MTGRERVLEYIKEGGIYCLTAEKFSRGRSNIEVVRTMLAAGIKIIQYREKTKKMGEKLAECQELRAITSKAGAAFIINDDVVLALLVDADGVHVGQDDLPVQAVRSLLGPDKGIGLSTHTPSEMQGAVDAGADYIGVGPIYATKTKEDVCAPVGHDYLDHVAANCPLPFVAIGGIKEHNIGEVVRHGATCIAMITEIVADNDMEAAIHRLNRAMGSEQLS